MLSLLRLQQLADSALPIGGAAHSFGLESLVDAGLLNVDNLAAFFEDHLSETGVLEAAYCAASHGASIGEWLALNTQLGARKLARESRDASCAMGRRFLRLAAAISNNELLLEASDAQTDAHLAACFGLAAGVLEIDARTAAAAFRKNTRTKDYTKSLKDLEAFYVYIHKHSLENFEAKQMAKLELEWWLVHRYPKQYSQSLEEALAQAMATLYNIKPQPLIGYAKFRAQAMHIRDIATWQTKTEPDWQKIENLLLKSYEELKKAVTK